MHIQYTVCKQTSHIAETGPPSMIQCIHTVYTIINDSISHILV